MAQQKQDAEYRAVETGRGTFGTGKGVHFLDVGDDIQPVIDQDDTRSIPVELAPGTHVMDGPVTVGQETFIKGFGGDILDQPGFDRFDALTVLDFASAGDVDGFVTDVNASYRPQRPRFRDMALEGSGPANASDAFRLEGNSAGDVGLAEMVGVYVEDYERGVYGDSNTDSGQFYRTHFFNVNRGFWKLGSGNFVIDSFFWEFDSSASTPVVIQTQGHGNQMWRNHMTPKHVDAWGYWALDGARNRFVANMYRGAYGIGVKLENAPNCVISKNKFDGDPGNRIVEILSGSDGTWLEGNQYTATTVNSPNTAIYIESGHNQVRDSVDMAGLSETVRVADGAFNWIFLNRWPDGAVVESTATRTHLYGPTLDWSQVSDSGDRTTVNDVGLNAGDPNSTGQWYTNGYEGLRVRDTNNSDTYLYVNGNFVQISST